MAGKPQSATADDANLVRDSREEYTSAMSTIQHIETAIRQLSPEDLASFRAWFAEFDAEAWDQQLEADVSSGRLDWLAEDAARDQREGRCMDR